MTDRQREKGPGNLAVFAPRRERLAIVSTYDKLCGIAAYTRALERQLADIFDVTVFDLDQDLLRSRHGRTRRLGDAHIKEICGKLSRFDAVNLQLEFGILGKETRDIRRRLAWLTTAAPRLSVTFHTVRQPEGFSYGDFFRRVGTLKFVIAAGIVLTYHRNRQLSVGVARLLSRAAKRKPIVRSSITGETRRIFVTHTAWSVYSTTR